MHDLGGCSGQLAPLEGVRCCSPPVSKSNLSAVMMVPHWRLEECKALGLTATARTARDLLASVWCIGAVVMYKPG